MSPEERATPVRFVAPTRTFVEERIELEIAGVQLELVDYVTLPERFASLDYLADYYGSVWGTVRQIYAQELGWFDGDPTSKRLMADALDALGENTLNTPARHYSFSYANRLRREAGEN